MADETKNLVGEMSYTGDVKLELNPPTAQEEGVNYGGHWVRAELDDEGEFTVRLYGTATYGSRTLSDFTELTDPGLKPIKDMLAQVLRAYGPHAQTTTMASAYAARSFALNQGESLKSETEVKE